MDTIKFQLSNTDKNSVVNIFINDRNIIEIAQEIEFPFAKAEGSPSIAGSYMGLGASNLLPLFNHFMPTNEDGKKTTLLRCGGCGDEGCWPLRVDIEVNDSNVIWEHFEQPHRAKSRNGNPVWSYEGLQFVFDKVHYENELFRFEQELKNNYSSYAELAYDEDYGWVVLIFDGYEYFDAPEDQLMLEISNHQYLCKTANKKLQFWHTNEISKKEWDVESWESVEKIIYLPDNPIILFDWLNEFFDLDLFEKSLRNEPKFNPEFNPNIGEIQGIRYSPSIPVFIQVLEAGKLLTIEPHKKVYAEYQEKAQKSQGNQVNT